MMKLKVIFSILLILVIFVLLPLQYNMRAKHNVKIVKAVVTKEVTVKLQNDVSKIVSRNSTKVSKVKETHVQNSVKIQQVKQSDIVLTNEFIATINNGLCQYKATTGCNSSKLF